jgi:hypothetical protein
MEYAHQDYREFLEGLIHERLVNPQGNRGSDILLMFKEKAEWPEKYREEVKVIGVDASKQMMDKLRELAMKERERAALEAPAIEGEFKEVRAPSVEKPIRVDNSLPAEPPPAPKKGSRWQSHRGSWTESGGSEPKKPGRYQQRREKPGRQFTRR